MLPGVYQGRQHPPGSSIWFITPTLDTFILASKKIHTFWFTRLISYFNVSYLGFSPL